MCTLIHFHSHNPLGSTQPLTEMSTRLVSWGLKTAGAYGSQPYHLHGLNVLKPRSLNFLPGTE